MEALWVNPFGHEVAACIKQKKWLEAVKSEGDGFHGFLNIVEDARIEKRCVIVAFE